MMPILTESHEPREFIPKHCLALLIEDIEPNLVDLIKDIFVKEKMNCFIEDIYHLILPSDILNEIQLEHKQCFPFYMPIETGKTWLKLEFLVRSKNILRCDCIRRADAKQRAFAMQVLEDLIKSVGITF